MRHLWSWLARSRGHSPSSCTSPQPRPVARVRLEVEKLEARETPAVLGAGTGLTAQYYGDMNLSQLLLTRTDATVNLDSTKQATPAPGVAGTHFGVRWTGQVQAPTSETYTFTTLSDDGVRLLVNGQLLVNDWNDHGARPDSGSLALVAGQRYSIEMDYYQDLAGFTAQLSWASPSTPKQVVPSGQLYPATSPPPLAPFTRLSAANVTTAGGTSQTFRVTYLDSAGVDPTSLSNGDVRVTGPNGFNQLATLVSVDSPTTTQRTATYRVTAPGGTFDAGDNGTYTVALQAGEVKNIRGTPSPAGVLGTFQVQLSAATPDWFSQNLHDATLTGLARGLDADHVLSRTDVLALFKQADQDGQVTTNELSDLKVLVANAGPLGMPDPVRELANKVVNGDPANAHYQGTALGNLTAGATGGLLQNLVNKWFLGTDHPAVGSGVTYVSAAGTLFGSGGPSYTDVVQGLDNDCYLLAAAAAVAYRDPSALQNAFIDNGDGTFTVRFYNNGVADYVTVDRMLPEASNGTYQYANFKEALNGTGNKLWVALLEKAYAQLAESGWSRGAGKASAYSSIEFGAESDAIDQITGKTASAVPLFTLPSTLTSINTALASGQMVCLDSNTTTAPGIVANHVYVVLGYNAATQTFNTYNPWGYTQQLTWSQVTANFSYWTRA